MKQFAITVLIFWATLGLGPAMADGDAARQMEITESAWVRATPPNRTITAGYLAIRNKGSVDHRLVGADSPVAGRAELHTHVHDRESGMMQMRHVDSIDLPAGETVRLAPGGLHIMLMDLNRDLQPGTSVPITLEFADGSRLELDAPVMREAPAGQRGQHPSQEHGHHRH
jgi:periplasmic copper chaperone A